MRQQNNKLTKKNPLWLIDGPVHDETCQKHRQLHGLIADGDYCNEGTQEFVDQKPENKSEYPINSPHYDLLFCNVYKKPIDISPNFVKEITHLTGNTRRRPNKR